MAITRQQTGTLTFGATDTQSDTLSITATPARAWLTYTKKGGADRADNSLFEIFLSSDGTTVTANRSSSTDTGLEIEYQVTEAPEFTVQHVQTVDSLNTVKIAAITAVDLDFSFISYDGLDAVPSGSIGNNELAVARFNSTTEAAVELGTGSSNDVHRLQIVEMSSSEIASVQFFGQVSVGSGTTQAITSVDVDKTLIFASILTSAGTLRSDDTPAIELTSSTVVDLSTYGSGNSGTVEVNLFVVEFVNLDVTSVSIDSTSLTETEVLGATPTYPGSINNGSMILSSADTASDDTDEQRWATTWSGATATFTRISNTANADLQARLFDFDAIFSSGNNLAADNGAYLYTGTAATITSQRILTADSGSYAYTGTAASLISGALLAADSGSYVYSGTNAGLISSRLLAADGGAYTYTGTAATLTFGAAGAFTLTADSGTYNHSGTANQFQVGRVLVADAGAYTYSGINATLTSGVMLVADAGSYAYTGTNVLFAQTRILAANAGAYVYTGNNVVLDFSGASVWTKQADSVTLWTEQADNTTTWTPQ